MSAVIEAAAPRTTPGGAPVRPCPACGKSLAVNQDGSLHKHYLPGGGPRCTGVPSAMLPDAGSVSAHAVDPATVEHAAEVLAQAAAVAKRDMSLVSHLGDRASRTLALRMEWAEVFSALADEVENHALIERVLAERAARQVSS